MQTIPVLGGRYRLGPEIGSGGMGAVHRAWDERFEREVAIKIVKSGDVEKERLRREAQYLARLNHPNLVAVLDAGEDLLRRTESVWFAMELVHGPDLRTVLRQDGPMDGRAVRRVLIGLLAALDALHAAGVVHRDMKPANVLLTAEPATGRWEVKLVDLGIAQHVRTDSLTSTGQVVGTAAYLSPEQVRGRSIGPATDVYALGLLVIEALSGTIAFPGAAAESAAARLVRAPDLPYGVDPAWRAVLTAMTALDPADRPPVRVLMDLVERLPDEARSPAGAELSTAQETAVLEDRSTVVLPAMTRRAAARDRRGPRRHVLAGACVLLALVAAGGWFAAFTGGASPTADAHTSTAPSAHATNPTPTASATTKRAVAVVPSPAASTSAAAPSAAAPATPNATDPARASHVERTTEQWRERLSERLHGPRPHR